MRRSFLGGFLGAALQPVITRVTARTVGPLLLGAAVLVTLAVQWFRAQPTWLQVLMVVGVLAVLFRPWRHRPQRMVAVEVPTVPPLSDQVTFLYRWWDADDRLLYVGISNDLARRTGQHLADKPWMVEAVRCEATSYPNRQAALDAEEHAIYRENPLHNIVHNRGPVW